MPNVTIGNLTLTFPEWHEEARKMRADGVALIKIAEKFNVSPSRVSQVTNERWQDYLVKDATRSQARNTEKKEAAMPDRHFEKFVSKNPEETRQGVIIRCHKCEKTDLFMRPGSIDHTHAARVFRNRGWHVGGGPRADTCDDCYRKIASPKKESIDATIGKYDKPAVPTPKPAVPPYVNPALPGAPVQSPPVTVPPMATTTPAPVKSTDTMTPMTKADKRIIWARLDDVYADEKIGYKEDWDDEKLAKDLGVPVQWVAEVRDENFGPNTNAILAKAAVIAGKVKEAKALADGVLEAKNKIEELLDKLAAETERFDKAVADFMGAYNKLNGDAPSPEKAAA